MSRRPHAATFDAIDVHDGSVLDTFVIGERRDVRRAVDAARSTGEAWASVALGRRLKVLRSWRGELWRGATELATLLHRETGVGVDEAMLEVVLAVEHLKWIEANAARALASTTHGAGPLSPEMATRTSLEPVGVVSVFALSQAGLYAPVSAMACALAAGNTVVLQGAPEITASLVACVAALPKAETLIQVLTGDEETADLLAATSVDQAYVVGTGRAAARIAGQCGQRLVPTTLVPIDPPLTVVAPDADLDAAAAAVARSVAAGSRADQEWRPEVFVAPDISRDFDTALHVALEQLTAAGPTALLRRGALPRALTSRRARVARVDAPAQLGAGAPRGHRPAQTPVVVHESAEFGEVLQRLGERPYAHVSVFSRRRGQRISEMLRAAQVSINLGAVTADAGLPRRAWGANGYGPLAGDAGLRGFTRAVTTTARRRLALPSAPADLLLATPAGRVAARMAMHLRHARD